MKKIIVVSFEIDTDREDKENSDIETAIHKGLAYGLDVKHICGGTEIKNTVITIL